MWVVAVAWVGRKNHSEHEHMYLNSNGSCGITLMCLRKALRGTLEVSTPSITILPLEGVRRNSAYSSEDFPAPVLPTMPIFSLRHHRQCEPVLAEGEARIDSQQSTIFVVVMEGDEFGLTVC